LVSDDPESTDLLRAMLESRNAIVVHAWPTDAMPASAGEPPPDLLVADFGDRNINSRIGAQWKTQGRVEGLDDAARRVPPAERGAMKMNAKLERCV
jgi:DNA-binding response OmpR family regulator